MYISKGNLFNSFFFFRKTDLYIGGWSIGARASPSVHVQSLRPYDFDSMAWCVQRAKKMPTWQNITTILKDRECLIAFLFVFYSISLCAYIFAYFENLKFFDGHMVLIKVLQVVLNAPVHYFPRQLKSRFLFYIGILCAMIMYMHFISFYMVVIKLSIDKYQIQSRDDLIRYNYQLAGDQQATGALNRVKMVLQLILSNFENYKFHVC